MLDWIFWMPVGATIHEMLVFVAILWTIHQVVALGSHLCFHSMHHNNWFPALRVKNGAAPSDTLLRSAWKEWFLNHIVSIPVYMAVVLYPLFLLRGGNISAPLPSVLEVLMDISVCVFVNETIFYFSHRFLHHKKMFRRIHRKHHAFRHVRPVCSEYAHPFENSLNLLAMYAGLVIMGSHFCTWGLWVAFRIYETNDGHSGYEHIDSASRHAYHHLYPTKGCYGTALGLWDWVLGTDKHWRAWKEKRVPEQNQ